jgi:hypothetical protein
MKKIKLSDLRIDGGTQMRENIDQPTVYRYLEDMKNGDVFPHMMAFYDGSSYWLVNGFHRYHAYKLLNIKEIEIEYKPGTLQEAINYACGANHDHGLQRTNKDKRLAIKRALENPLNEKATNYEIAKICHVSQPMVAAMRDSKTKEKQEKNRQASAEKKIENTNPISSLNTTVRENPNKNDGAAPDSHELRATELAHLADIDAMHKLLESNDALQTAYDEIKRLNAELASLKLREDGLINEKTEAIKMVKKLQKELDRIRGKK